MTELLPCPLCSGVAPLTWTTQDERNGYRAIAKIKCNDCGLALSLEQKPGPNGWTSDDVETVAQLIDRLTAAWNTRAAPAEAELRAEVERLTDRANRLLVNVERNGRRQSADTMLAASELRELLGERP